jgi:hypothetical protein
MELVVLLEYALSQGVSKLVSQSGCTEQVRLSTASPVVTTWGEARQAGKNKKQFGQRVHNAWSYRATARLYHSIINAGLGTQLSRNNLYDRLSTERRRKKADHFLSRRSILDHVSRRPIVLLNTSLPDVESGSAQK